MNNEQHLEPCNVLDGEIDERGNDSGEQSHEERQSPLQEHVLQHLNLGPAPPVMLEQIILIDPGTNKGNTKQSCFEDSWINKIPRIGSVQYILIV